MIKGNAMTSPRFINVAFTAREVKLIREGMIELEQGVPFEKLRREVRDAFHAFTLLT